MHRLMLLACLAIAAGCAAPPEKADVTAPAPPQVAKIEKVDLSATSNAVLYSDNDLSAKPGGNDGDKENSVKVGDKLEDVIKVFPKEKAKGFTDLPPTLDKEMFEAWGWETKNGNSFGAIVDRNTKQVVLVMRSLKDVGEGDLANLVGRYSNVHDANKTGGSDNAPKPTVDGKAARYYFWDAGTHRLMICAVTNRHGGYNVAIALGESQVMDAIDASKEAATVAVAKAEKLLEKTPTTPSS